MQEGILRLTSISPRITRLEMAAKTGLTMSGIDWNLKQLRKRGLLIRLGSARKGRWQPVTEFRM